MPASKSTSDSILKLLTKHLEPKPRAAVDRRYQAMIRELAFMGERKSEDLDFLRGRKWSDERLKVLFGLNCIYQEIIGPLDASTRSGVSGIGSEYPIIHGGTRFDRAHSRSVRRAADDFFEMVAKLGFSRDWMTKNTCGDLVFHIARREREEAAGDSN